MSTVGFLEWSIPAQTLFNGMVLGLGYSVIAAGIVLIYRSSGIVNFAQAAMGAFGVASFVVLTGNHGVPYPVALALGVAGAVVLGVVTELLVVRRLFAASRVVLLIATVGVAQLIAFLILEVLPDTEGGVIPTALGADWATVRLSDSLTVGNRELSVIVLVVPALAALGYVLGRTRIGLHIRAVADSPENARLVGVSPRRVSTLVWAMAAGFAAYTQIAIAPIVTRTADELAGVSTIGLLLRALVIALAARMRSIPLVVVGGLVLGGAETVVAVNLNLNVGVFNAYLLVAVLALVLLHRRAGRDDDVGFSVGVRHRPIPADLQRIWWVRRLPAFGLAALLVPALLVPQLVTTSSELLTWTRLLIVAMVAISLSLLTGWAGQLSLGQFAFAGVGGLSMLAFTQGHRLGIGIPGIGELGAIAVELPWFAGLLAGTATGVAFALLIGLPSLRVKGLFLAVATLAFANMASNWMFGREFWNGGRSSISSVANQRPRLGPISFVPPANYYYLCLAFLVLVVLVVSRLRRTGAGRTMIAVRDNEPMTAAATVSPTRAKLSAFAVSGGIAALAGGLLVYLLPGFLASGSESPFSTDASLQLVAIAIIGGIGTVAGPILGALWVVGLPAAFGASDAVNLLTANIGLLVLLLYFPGGLVQILYAGRDALLRWLAGRIAEATPAEQPGRVARLTTRSPAPDGADPGTPWLDVVGVTVAFGGVRAVDDVSLQVRQGELVGLIGTNGAGKSTLMNAVSGFVPHSGRVTVAGREVSGLPAHRRHAVGLGRGFQDAALFPGLTVQETILVALEARDRSRLLPSLTGLPPSPASERRKRADADEIIGFVGLGPFAERFAGELSTGTRRIVELACLIATDARVLLLDEPTGGVAQRETEAFAPLIQSVQRDLDAAVVVIEHDMPLVMSISDRVYALEAGRVIAGGIPAEVQAHPAVIASYLGTAPAAPDREDGKSRPGGSTLVTRRHPDTPHLTGPPSGG